MGLLTPDEIAHLRPTKLYRVFCQIPLESLKTKETVDSMRKHLPYAGPMTMAEALAWIKFQLETYPDRCCRIEEMKV